LLHTTLRFYNSFTTNQAKLQQPKVPALAKQSWNDKLSQKVSKTFFYYRFYLQNPQLN
jgi:hypothetical protein